MRFAGIGGDRTGNRKCITLFPLLNCVLNVSALITWSNGLWQTISVNAQHKNMVFLTICVLFSRYLKICKLRCINWRSKMIEDLYIFFSFLKKASKWSKFELRKRTNIYSSDHSDRYLCLFYTSFWFFRISHYVFEARRTKPTLMSPGLCWRSQEENQQQDLSENFLKISHAHPAHKHTHSISLHLFDVNFYRSQWGKIPDFLIRLPRKHTDSRAEPR